MSIYEAFNETGKKSITASSRDFIGLIGMDGIKDIVLNVLLGGNVRDVTEFITQRRLMRSYAATLDLFSKEILTKVSSAKEYAAFVVDDLLSAKGGAKTLDLWLLGLTKKGLDNIVRSYDGIEVYKGNFVSTIQDFASSAEKEYGKMSAIIELNNEMFELNWEQLSLLLLAIGSQTLSIRGSSKSMNGKLFEKLVLGSLLSMFGFTYCANPPRSVNPDSKLFWLSSSDVNERETDATIYYDSTCVSIDIGFIGRGNPEISLDKVTRFGAYKEIGGIPYNMSTIIIVDSVGNNSDLFAKAEKVNGHILQMKNPTWVQEFAALIKRIYDINSDILSMSTPLEFKPFFEEKLSRIDFSLFFRNL